MTDVRILTGTELDPVSLLRFIPLQTSTSEPDIVFIFRCTHYKMSLAPFPVLFMDEAASVLGAQTEKALNEAIRHLSSDKTVVVIAHKEASLRYCQAIVGIGDRDTINAVMEKSALQPGSLREQ